MAKMRYVGAAPAQFHETKYVFSSYGQLVELPDDLVEAARAGRLSLLPAEQVEEMHTLEELKKYARFESHENQSDPGLASFLEKRKQLWIKMQTEHHPEYPLHPESLRTGEEIS